MLWTARSRAKLHSSLVEHANLLGTGRGQMARQLSRGSQMLSRSKERRQCWAVRSL